MTGRWIKVYCRLGDEPGDCWPISRRLLDTLTKFPWSFTTDELIRAMWEPEHEPIWPENYMRVVIWNMRRRFLPMYYPYLTIVSRMRRWRLVIRKPAGYTSDVRLSGEQPSGAGAGLRSGGSPPIISG